MKYLKRFSINESVEKLWREVESGEIVDSFESRGVDTFSKYEFESIKNLVKKYKINYKRSDIVTISKNQQHVYIHGLRKMLDIDKSQDSYFYVSFIPMMSRSMSSNFYICDDLEGLLQLLTDVIFKNYKIQDFDTEKLREEIINKVKTLKIEDLIKIKNEILG